MDCSEYNTLGNVFLPNDLKTIKARITNNSLKFFSPSFQIARISTDVLNRNLRTSELLYAGLGGLFKISRALRVYSMWLPVRTIVTVDGTSLVSKSDMYNMNISYNPSAQSKLSYITVSGNKFIQLFEENVVNSQSLNFSSGFKISEKWNIGLIGQYNKMTFSDSLSIENPLITMNTSLKASEKFSVSMGISFCDENIKNAGATISVNWMLAKFMTLDFFADKAILINNPYIPIGYRNPYQFNVSLTIKVF